VSVLLGRMRAMLRPSGDHRKAGVLFLVLPKRWLCINETITDETSDNEVQGDFREDRSNQAASMSAFSFFLQRIGFEEVIQRRVTPKLVFFTLKRVDVDIPIPGSITGWCKDVRIQKLTEFIKSVREFKTEWNLMPFCVCALNRRDDSPCSECHCGPIAYLPLVPHVLWTVVIP
jgi:hypothetical protein